MADDRRPRRFWPKAKYGIWGLFSTTRTSVQSRLTFKRVLRRRKDCGGMDLSRFSPVRDGADARVGHSA